MQVYKTFFKIARSYKTGILMYLGIVVVMLVLIVVSSRNTGDRVAYEQASYDILLVDQDHSEVSELLAEYLGTVHTLKEGSYSEDQIMDMLYYQSITEYIVIPEGFGDAYLNGAFREDYVGTGESIQAVYDEALPMGIFVNMQINEYLNSVKSYMDIGNTLDTASRKAVEMLDTASFVTIKEDSTTITSLMYGAFLFLPYGILTIISSGVMPVVLSFQEDEKKKRTMVSALRPGTRGIAIAAGTATLSAGVFVVLTMIASIPDAGSYLFTETWWLAVLNSLIYTFVVAMLVTMITCFPITNGAPVSMITNIVSLSFAFLGGTFVELDILGDKIAKVGRFTPNFWYSTALKQIFDGSGFDGVKDCFGMQLVFAIACLAVGLGASKYLEDRRNA